MEQPWNFLRQLLQRPHLINKFNWRSIKAKSHQIKLGVDWNEVSVAVVALEKKPNHDCIIGIGEAGFNHLSQTKTQLSAGKILALQQACLQAGINSGEAIIAVPDHLTLRHSIQLPRDLTALEIELHLLLEAERYFNLPGHTLYFDFNMSEPGKIVNNLNQIDVIAVAKQEIEPQIEILTAAGLQVTAVDLSSAALSRGLVSFIQSEKLGLIIRLCDRNLLSILMQNRKVLHIQQETISTLSSLTTATQIVQQYQWLQLSQPETIEQIWISGSDITLPELINPIQAALQIEPIIIDTLEPERFLNAEIAARFNASPSSFMLSYGLAQW